MIPNHISQDEIWQKNYKISPQTSSAPLLQDSNCSKVFRDMKITTMSERPVKWIAEAVQQTSTTSHSIVHSSSDFYILKDLQDVQAI
jgi:uncharacterized membrane protein required for colicin V production